MNTQHMYDIWGEWGQIPTKTLSHIVDDVVLWKEELENRMCMREQLVAEWLVEVAK